MVNKELTERVPYTEWEVARKKLEQIKAEKGIHASFLDFIGGVRAEWEANCIGSYLLCTPTAKLRVTQLNSPYAEIIVLAWLMSGNNKYGGINE